MNMNGVEWRPIVINGMNTQYVASELGNIMNIKSGLILKPVPYVNSGRPRVHLHLPDGTKKDATVYRLTWEAFNGPIPKNLTIDHIDDDFNNNNLSNLQLLTASENIKKYYRNHPDKGFQKKIPDETVHEFFKLLKKGMFFKEAAYRVGIDNNTAKGYINGRRRRDIWELYRPFPESAWIRTKIGKREKDRIKYLLLEGAPTREIIKDLSLEYDQYSINLVSKMRSELGISKPSIVDNDTWQSIEKLIVDGKSNKDIYSILDLEYSEALARKIKRRRNNLGIPDKRYSAPLDEIDFMLSSMTKGLRNKEILNFMGKADDKYYKQLCADLRHRKFKHDSTTIETVAQVSENGVE